MLFTKYATSEVNNKATQPFMQTNVPPAKIGSPRGAEGYAGCKVIPMPYASWVTCQDHVKSWEPKGNQWLIVPWYLRFPWSSPLAVNLDLVACFAHIFVGTSLSFSLQFWCSVGMNKPRGISTSIRTLPEKRETGLKKSCSPGNLFTSLNLSQHSIDIASWFVYLNKSIYIYTIIYKQHTKQLEPQFLSRSSW